MHVAPQLYVALWPFNDHVAYFSTFLAASNEAYPFHGAINEFVNRMMAEKLDQTIAKQLVALSKTAIPTDLTRDEQERWLTQNLLEQAALLELLFLMLYDRLQASPERLLHVVQNVLKPMGFGNSKSNAPQLNSSGRAALRRVGYLATLVTLSAMSLEPYVDDSSLLAVSRKLMDSAQVSPLDGEMRMLCTAPVPASGPILLAWAAMQCRITTVIPNPDYDWATLAAFGMQQRAFPYLNELLASGFSPDDPNLPGYKSVLRGFLSVVMSAFSLDNLAGDIKEMTELHNKVYSGMPPLCTLFWGAEGAHESQRALLDEVQLDFPAQDFSSLIRMVASLIADAKSASCAFEYLKKRPFIRQYLTVSRLNQVADEIPGQVATYVVRSHSDVVPFMTLRAGTRGTVVAGDPSEPGSAVTVLWHTSYSVWHTILGALDFFIDCLRTQIGLREESSSLTDKINDCLFLIATLFEGSRGDFTEPLVAHLAEVSDPNLWATPLLPRILLILQGAGRLKPAPIKLLTSAMKCLHGLAHTRPVEVWQEMRRTNLIDTREVRGWTPESGTIRHLLMSAEMTQGQYPITLAFLEMLQTILGYLQGWKNPAGSALEHAYPDEFAPFLLYVQTNIFTFYPSWRYNSIVEEWSIGYACLRIFNQILQDPVSESSKNANVRQSVLRSILFETGMIQVLVSIVGMGPTELERLRRRAKEGKRVERLVLEAFAVLERVLVLKQSLPDIGKATPLEYMLLTRQQGRDSLNMVYIIASYVRYYYSVHIPLMATKTLTLLCAMTVEEDSRPPSLVGYLGSKAEELRTEFLWKLSDNREVVELRIAIIRLIREALHFQPGLAELFLKDPAPTEDERRKKLHEDDNTAPLLDQSDNVASNCIKAVMGIVFKKEYMEMKPRLVSEALHFFEALWLEAPDHHGVIQKVTTAQKGNQDFWSRVVSSLEAVDERARADPVGVYNHGCFTTLSRSHILRILGLEVFHTKPSSPIATGLHAPLESIKSNQVKWFERFTQSSYNDESVKKLEQLARELSFDFSGLQVLDHYKNFGSNYLYDINAIRHRITFATPRPDAAQFEKGTELIALVKKVNTHAAIVDAELTATKSWTTFTKVATLRAKTDSANSLLALITSILKRLARESREALPVHTLDLELTSLLLLLVKRWASLAPLEGDASLVDVLQYLKSTFLRVNPTMSGMEVEFGGLGIPSQHSRDKMDPLPVLSNLLSALIYVLKNIKTWTMSIRDLAASLLPAVLDCCDETKLVTPALAVAELICQQAAEEVSAILAVLSERDTIGGAVQQFSMCIRERSNPQTAESLLHFFLAMAQGSPATCELLAVAGFVRAVCSETYVDDVINNLPFYLESGDRNPWHKIWCVSLSLLTKMLQSLRHRENFVDQVLEFVAAHQSRIDQALDLFQDAAQDSAAVSAKKPGPTLRQNLLTVAKVEETDSAAGLLHELVHYRRRWRVILDSPYSDTANSVRLESNVLSLLHQAAESLLINGTASIKAVSAQERKMWDQANSRAKDTVAVDLAAAKPAADSGLVQRVKLHLFQVVRSCLGFIWLLSPRVFSEDEDPETLVPIFAVDEQPQLSLLTKIATAASKGLTSLNDQAAPPPSETELLLNVVEFSAAIVLAHLTMFMGPRYDERIRRRSRDEFAPDLETVISSLTPAKMKKGSEFLASCQAWIKKMGTYQF